MYYATILGGGGKTGNVTMCKGSDVKVSSLKGVVGNNLLELASEGIRIFHFFILIANGYCFCIFYAIVKVGLSK